MNHATLKTVPVHSGAKFDWHEGVGATDASTLGPRWSSRVWADAADVGFVVRSQRTGKTMLFVHTGTELEKHSGEVLCATFESDSGVKIRVYND
jgi:hypothetical protein